MQCTKSFNVVPGKSLQKTLDFINFFVLKPRIYSIWKITLFFFCAISVSLLNFLPRAVWFWWLVCETSFWFSICCAWCFAFSSSLCCISMDFQGEHVDGVAIAWWVDAVLLAADIEDDFVDDRCVVLCKIGLEYFQKVLYCCDLAFGFTFALSIFIGFDLKATSWNLISFSVNVIRHSCICKTSTITCFGAHRRLNCTYFFEENYSSCLKTC